MKYSINFSDRHGNETDNIEVTISENSIEIPDLDFNGTLDTLYKTRGFFVETGTVSLPVGKKYPKGGIFSMKKLLKFVGLSREKEVVPEVPEVILKFLKFLKQRALCYHKTINSSTLASIIKGY